MQGRSVSAVKAKGTVKASENSPRLSASSPFWPRRRSAMSDTLIGLPAFFFDCQRGGKNSGWSCGHRPKVLVQPFPTSVWGKSADALLGKTPLFK